MNALMWLESNLDVRKGADDRNVSANCPFCEEVAGKPPDRKHHLGISLDKAVCHCFRCGYRGTLVKLIKDVAGISYAEAAVLISSSKGGRRLTLSPDKPPAQDTVEFPLPDECRSFDPKSALHRAAMDYLRKRGIPRKTVDEFKLGFCVIGEYGQRIIIPITYRGRLVGFTSRTITPGVEPKYKFPHGFRAQNFLYNYDRAAKSRHVIVVEGPVDAWRMPDNAVALFTNKISFEQSVLIARSRWKRVTVMLDRDAVENAYHIAVLLSPHVHTDVAVLPNSKDPGDAPLEEIKEAIAHAAQGVGVML